MIPFLSFSQKHQSNDTSCFIYKLMESHLPNYNNVLAHPEKYRLQIIYTEINRDFNNNPSFKSFYFRKRPDEYFYPASTVKLALSALTLEKLNNLDKKGINKDTRIAIEKSYKCQTAVDSDPASVNGVPTLGNYISKALIVSDNNSYNRMYEFLGQKYINKRLKRTGFNKARILHRFTICSQEENRHTNAFWFLDSKGKVIYHQSPLFNRKKYKKPIKNMEVGKGYIDQNDHLVNKPMDFSHKNYISLDDLTEILKRLVFPDLYPSKKRFNLKQEDYDFLLKQLGAYPDECTVKTFHDTSVFFRPMTNYLIYGREKNCVTDTNIRIFNIVGQAYGFLTDCAYIVDFSKNIEFFLSATIYVNEDNILNDDIYEYQTIGFPFLKNLGLLFYDYEKTRERKYSPDLYYFKSLFPDIQIIH